MFYCEECRVKEGWTRGLRGCPTSQGRCEMCEKPRRDCYDVPSHALDAQPYDEPDEPTEKVDECPSCRGRGRVQDPEHGQGQKCEPCGGTGLLLRSKLNVCEVTGCKRGALPQRKLCEFHAYPAARKPGTTGRKAAVAATKKKYADQAKD